MPDNYWGNAARQFGQGLTFGFSDELEAAIRAASGGDFAKYQTIKANLEKQRKQWADANPKAAMAAEVGGALIPGLIPGGQGASAGALARAARVLDAPVERALARAAPRALSVFQGNRAGRLGLSVADELANGAMYSVGQAPTVQDIPKQIKDDAVENILGSLAVRTATGGGKAAVRKIKGRR